MSCFSPLQGYAAKEVTSKGKRKTTFNVVKARGYEYGLPEKRVVRCNRCSGCRLDYSREWAVRCMHEASLHRFNSFVTLTYSPQFIPTGFIHKGNEFGYGTLNPDHFSKFMKRLRKAIAKPTFINLRNKYGSRFASKLYWKLAYSQNKIRFYMGSEYGDLNGRPHYHILVFGYDFPDKVLHSVRNGYRLYRSSLLESVWKFGYSSIGSCTFESAAYVARYMMKKVKGEDLDGRYVRFNSETGEIHHVFPEFARMSNRDGIGKRWFDLFAISDVYNKDFVTMGNGIRCRPPSYYDRKLEVLSPERYEAIKASRTSAILLSKADNTPERLAIKEICHLAKLSNLKRTFNKDFS